jgi:uncharacterized protein
MTFSTSIASRAGVLLLLASALSACDAPPRITELSANQGLTREQLADAPGRSGGFGGFTALTSSFACTASGGDPVNPLLLPTGFTQTIVASEPAVGGDAIDMNTENETGPQRGRFLYRPTESGVGTVSVTDLETGVTKVIAARPDWESFDPIVWTPWGTLLVGEEANVQSRPDPKVPGAIGGLMYELFLDEHDPTVVTRIIARPALGAKAHEGNRFDSNGNHYGISEANPGFIFKFTPDHKGDLSSGQLYALKITKATGDRTGEAEWVPLDRSAVQIDANKVARDSGATGYNRPEDIEIGTSSGRDVNGKDILYVAVTGQANPVDNRIIAIDLRSGDGEDDANEGNGQERHARGTVFVYDYVKWGLNVAQADFSMPDNLALDHDGNLFIAEDPGGSFPGKRNGDDVWMAVPPHAEHAPAASVQRFFSLTDCDAEPTGLYVDLKRDMLFVNVQHRGGDHLDKAVAIQRSR